MRTIIYIIIFLSGFIITKAQSRWISITSENEIFSFQMPAMPALYDTTNISYYHLDIDTTINMHVNYVAIDTLLNPADVLNVFSRNMILITQGELVSIRDTILDGTEQINGKEIGVKYLQDEEMHFTFTQVFYWQNQLLALSISSKQADLTSLIDLKELFFNSLEINN